MTNTDVPAEGTPFVYQSRLDLDPDTVALVVTAIGTYRAKVKSRWRKLPDFHAALIVLAVLRHNQRPADLAAANGISRDTVDRWVRQTITTLARIAARLDRVLDHAQRDNTQVLLLDGTCLPTEITAGGGRRNYWCGKHKTHHLRVLTITDQTGQLLWTSAATGARTHEATQAKRQHIPKRLRTRDLTLICDRAHTRLDDQATTNPTVITGYRASRNRKLTKAEKQVNTLISRERVANEHAHAHLKNWRILTRLRHGWLQQNTTTLLRALLVLTNTEINRRPTPANDQPKINNPTTSTPTTHHHLVKAA